MKPPVRWLEGGADVPPGARDVLADAPPPPPYTDELRYRLGAGVAKTAALPVVAGWSTLLLKGVAVAAIGGASGLAVHHLAASRDAQPSPSAVSSPAVTVPALPPIESPPPVPVAPLPAMQLPTAPPPAPRLKLDPRLQEAEVLERARSLIASNPGAALKLTADYGRDFPKGRLGAEADLIAAQSLLAMGNTSAAKARAMASLKRYPSGLYARQLRDIVER